MGTAPNTHGGAMFRLVLLRHGESLWNRENRFTGWTDVDLSDSGIVEAQHAGRLLERDGFDFDIVFTSVLKRAIRTAWIVLDEMDLLWLPVFHSWRLNERHYGALQGLNKAEVAARHGERQVEIWRRSYDVPPPPLELNDPRHPSHDRRYRDLGTREIPVTEALKNTLERLLPFWHEVIAPCVKSGKRVLICAHGNSIRALVKHLDRIPDSEIIEIEIPTAVPLVYELDRDLNPCRHYYLRDQSAGGVRTRRARPCL